MINLPCSFNVHLTNKKLFNLRNKFWIILARLQSESFENRNTTERFLQSRSELGIFFSLYFLVSLFFLFLFFTSPNRTATECCRESTNRSLSLPKHDCYGKPREIPSRYAFLFLFPFSTRDSMKLCFFYCFVSRIANSRRGSISQRKRLERVREKEARFNVCWWFGFMVACCWIFTKGEIMEQEC